MLPAGGPNPSAALTLTTATDGRPGVRAADYAVRAGQPLTRTYMITATGEADVHDMTLVDDQISAADIRCGTGPSNTVAIIRGLSSVTCTARTTAAAGRRIGTARATGTVLTTSSSSAATAAAPTGYFGMVASLTINETAGGIGGVRSRSRVPMPEFGGGVRTRVGGEGLAVSVRSRILMPDLAEGARARVRTQTPISLRYDVTDTGNVSLFAVALTDDVATGAAIQCPAGGAEVGRLDPGQTVECVASLDPGPGEHSGVVRAVAVDRVTLLDPSGALRSDGPVTAEAVSRYVGDQAAASGSGVPGSNAPGTSAPGPAPGPAKGMPGPPGAAAMMMPPAPPLLSQQPTSRSSPGVAGTSPLTFGRPQWFDQTPSLGRPPFPPPSAATALPPPVAPSTPTLPMPHSPTSQSPATPPETAIDLPSDSESPSDFIIVAGLLVIMLPAIMAAVAASGSGGNGGGKPGRDPEG